MKKNQDRENGRRQTSAHQGGRAGKKNKKTYKKRSQLRDDRLHRENNELRMGAPTGIGNWGSKRTAAGKEKRELSGGTMRGHKNKTGGKIRTGLKAKRGLWQSGARKSARD